MAERKKLNSTELAKMRTKMANQRTYLAYMRTGFGIAALAGSFKKTYLAAFGVLMIMVSTAQYYHVMKSVNDELEHEFDYHIVPIFYAATSLIVLYLQFHK